VVVVSSNGYVKLTDATHVSRGAVAFIRTAETGDVAGFAVVGPLDDVQFTQQSGKHTRMEVQTVKRRAYAAQCKLIDDTHSDPVIAVRRIADPDGVLTTEVGKPW
jgi:hypothetical protein